jgi:hypothetical protein
MNKRFFYLLLLCFFATQANAERTRATQLQTSIINHQLLVDGQIALGITPTMESALLHGIALEYSIDIRLDDPERHLWQNPLLVKRTRVKLSFDSLKQTYLLTNLSLQRFSTDRDLKRSLMTLGAIQSLPIAQLNQLQKNHPYHLRLRVQLERDSLPNALRLSSIIDPEWRIDMDWQTQKWVYE